MTPDKRETRNERVIEAGRAYDSVEFDDLAVLEPDTTRDDLGDSLSDDLRVGRPQSL